MGQGRRGNRGNPDGRTRQRCPRGHDRALRRKPLAYLRHLQRPRPHRRPVGSGRGHGIQEAQGRGPQRMPAHPDRQPSGNQGHQPEMQPLGAQMAWYPERLPGHGCGPSAHANGHRRLPLQGAEPDLGHRQHEPDVGGHGRFTHQELERHQRGLALLQIQERELRCLHQMRGREVPLLLLPVGLRRRLLPHGEIFRDAQARIRNRAGAGRPLDE